MNFIVCHTGRHHVINLYCGIKESGHRVSLAVPFYCFGLFRGVADWNFNLALKMRSYYDERVEQKDLLCGYFWGFSKILSLLLGVSIDKIFDLYVAALIFLRIWRPDILVVLQNHMPIAVISAKARGIRVWVDVINYSSMRIGFINHSLVKNGGKRLSLPGHDSLLSAERSDFITAPYLSNELKHFLYGRNNYEIIPYGVNLKKFSMSKPSLQGFKVVFRANSYMKGASVALDFILNYGHEIKKLINPRNLRFEFIGDFDSNFGDKFTAACRDLDIDFVYGGVPNANMPNVFKEANIFVMPSLSESMSMMAIEAMSSGVPLILSEECGLGDILPDKYPFVFKEINSKKIFDSFFSLIANESLYLDCKEKIYSSSRKLSWACYESRVGDFAKKISKT